MPDEALLTAPRADPIDSLADWLMECALDDVDIQRVIAECCDRLVAAGIPLWRVQMSFRTLHPLISAISVIWLAGEVVSEGHPHGRSEQTEDWLRSPFHHMLKTRTKVLRRRLTGPEAALDFPVLVDRRDAGATDWLGYMVPFSANFQDGIIASWTTDREGGFSDAEIRTLLRIQKRLAVAVKVGSKEQIAFNVLSAYLGPESGRRVLNGQIRRGDGETIRAVVWYSDMRDSTAIAGALPARRLLEVVNTYFECSAGAVIAAGGQVLQLIGDAVLAIFPIRGGVEAEAETCGRVLAAARDAMARLDAVHRDTDDPQLRTLAFGLGIHLGDLVYGNVGVPERVEFGVVGVTVNETARLQDLTKSLGADVIASEEVARHHPLAWHSLGRHNLRGVGEPHAVYGLRMEGRGLSA